MVSRENPPVVGWYCVDNPDTGIKDCEKRLMRNGVPVNDTVYDNLGRPVVAAGTPSTAQTPSPLTAIVPLEDGTADLKVENRGPAPRATIDYVDRTGGEGRGGNGVPNDRAKTAFTLQLGVFRDEAQCRRFVTDKSLPADQVTTHRLPGEENDWCLVTYGVYASHQEASSANQALTRRYPGISSWVRSLSSIEQIPLTR
ncbi:MAG: hypothetical protein CMK32_02120 [Porticoccaceae bacterium]|nr:hypothetical protein [Porticoccaceae bacterium]